MAIIPKVKIVKDELPQWIIASDRAAYTPASHTIWLAWRGDPISFSIDFMHEVGHHILHILGFKSPAHYSYDKYWSAVFKTIADIKSKLKKENHERN